MSSELDRWHECWLKRHGVPMQLATHPDTEDLHRWDGGAWQNITARFARTLIAETGWSLSSHAAKEALFQATNLAPYLGGDRHRLDDQEPWINFRNGIFDLNSGQLRPHAGPWNTTTQIPHDYRTDLGDLDVELATMELDTYLRERVADDTADAGVLWQILGAAMLPGNPGQTFTILQGPGGSGKGTFLGLMRDLIGPENVTTLTLAQMGDRFASAGLHGALANVAGDVTGGAVPAYELILGITGGDAITADRKYRDPLTFTWDGLLILATNGRLVLPSGAGSESGWWRRALYVDMPHAVPASERVNSNELRERIAPNFDLVATRAADAVRVAWQDGNVPVITNSMVQSSAAARASGDTVVDWAEDRLRPDSDAELLGKCAYADYSAWCARFGHQARGHQGFYADLTNTLTRWGWGERLSVRRTTSKAVFTGARVTTEPIWQRL